MCLGWLREDQAVLQVHSSQVAEKQRRSGWMKVRKGGVEVRKMALADPFLTAYPRILYGSSVLLPLYF